MFGWVSNIKLRMASHSAAGHNMELFNKKSQKSRTQTRATWLQCGGVWLLEVRKVDLFNST